MNDRLTHVDESGAARMVDVSDKDVTARAATATGRVLVSPRVVELLREQGVEDVLITVGGTIPADDVPELKKLGVSEVFTPGAPTDEIVEFIRGGVGERD